MSTTAAILLCASTMLGATWRAPTGAELNLAKQALGPKVADPGFEVMESNASPDEGGVMVFVKLRERTELGFGVSVWRVTIRDEKVTWVMQLPVKDYPSKESLAAGQAMMGWLQSMTDPNVMRPGGSKAGKPKAKPKAASENLAAKLAPPRDPSVRYMVVSEGKKATIYIWAQTRWREVGPAVVMALDAMPIEEPEKK